MDKNYYVRRSKLITTKFGGKEMAWESPKWMDEYLRSTKLFYCDFTKLKGKAKEIIKGAKTPKEAALKVLYQNEIVICPTRLIQPTQKAAPLISARWAKRKA